MENTASMTDEELNDIIFAEESTTGETSESVSPADESEEQPTESEVDTGVDQSTEEEEDSEEGSTDEDQTDGSEEETSTESDEGEEDDTEPDEDKGTEAESTKQKFQPLRANGKEYPIDDINELYKLASAGVGAQQKFQAIAGHKKTIMAAEKAGVDLMEAVNMMARYKENPKEAILSLMKENSIDPLDVDLDEVEANTKDYSVSDFEAQYDEIVGEIGNSPVFPKVQDLLVNGWDERSRAIFMEDPTMIRNLHDEMSPSEELEGKSMFDLVSPIAEKMKLSGDMRSDFDVYMDARAKKVEELQKFSQTKEAVKPTPKAKATKTQKKKATPTGGKSGGVKTLDFAAMSDAELDAFLEKA